MIERYRFEDLTVIAASSAAVTVDNWLPHLNTVSTLAAEWLPIIGVASLGLTVVLRGVQIWRSIFK